MDYRTELQKTINYIESNVKNDIKPKDLSDMICFSEKHYYRLFKKYIGVSVMDYIRRRRLAHAIYDIVTGARVIDAALNYGFESHGGFDKAFKKQYGLSPQKYMLYAAKVPPKPIDLLNQNQKYKIDGGVIMEPKIIRKPTLRIAGYGLKSDGAKYVKDQPALWADFNIDGIENKLYSKLKTVKHGEYCVCCENNAQTGEFIYAIGVEVENFDDAPSDMITVEIPPSDYAVFTTAPVDDASFPESIQNAWNYIINEWFPDSGYLWDEGKPDFEFYDERSHDEVDKVMEICIPVIRK